jgi:outer membrane lipase/esterase
MASRRQWHLSFLSAVVGAALLAACGGGGSDEKLDVGKVVSFGDSLSDLGTYSVVTSIAGTGAPPFFAGRFTTNTYTGYTAASNTNTATIWVEWVATRVGVPITQAMLGYATTRIPCPVTLSSSSPLLAGSCTAYGMGGSRVSNANGYKHAEGALADPLTTQVATHLAKFGGFSSNDIVFAWTGANDFLVQMDDLGHGLIDAPTAVANMQTAGTELATLLKSQVLANGASRVAALTLPDPGLTPDYVALPAANKAFLTQMTSAYNGALLAGLNGSNVQIIDVAALIADVVTRPAAYGLANTTAAACDPAKIAAVTGGKVTDGSALFCNAAAGQPFNTMAAGASATTWFFAASGHPTTGGHKIIADFVITKIKSFGWVPPNL